MDEWDHLAHGFDQLAIDSHKRVQLMKGIEISALVTGASATLLIIFAIAFGRVGYEHR